MSAPSTTDYGHYINSSTGQTFTQTQSQLQTGESIHLALKKIVEIYVVLLLCIFGISGNALSIAILGRDRHVRRTTGFLLQMVAIADALYLTTCLFFQTLNTIQRYTDWSSTLTHIWPYLEPYVWPCASIAQTSAVWLVVVLTADRYVAICKPLQASQFSTRSRARRSVCVVWTSSIIYNLPRFFERTAVVSFDTARNATVVSVKRSAMRENMAYILVYKTLLFFIVRFFVPLAMLAFFNARLVRAINESRQLDIYKHQAKITNLRSASTNMTSSGGKTGNADEKVKRKTTIEKYTSMLLIVVLVFLICEMPDFMLRMWISIHVYIPGVPFPLHVLRAINVVSNLFLTFNSCVNFVIYCFMGRTFRRILLQMLCQKTGRHLGGIATTTSRSGCHGAGGNHGHQAGHSRYTTGKHTMPLSSASFQPCPSRDDARNSRNARRHTHQESKLSLKLGKHKTTLLSVPRNQTAVNSVRSSSNEYSTSS